MTIQISVIIWTVICFILLMLILNNLLFKPLLDIMDKRREKIEAARAKRAEYDRVIAENKKLSAEKKAEHEADSRRLIKERVEKLRSDQKKAVEAAKEVRLQRLDESRRSTEAEEAQILTKLCAHSEELAIMLADKIVKG